ncbi:MATE family efflux transporter [Salisediminibacterium beveridgei]|uniref:Na+ driven multidrug efflux pump n=1 Tax=Salisediminibacterium beveridgei TaxID=632773 RepID=A0A1D7QXE8_9BACI|nr:MATE family efflux transporter [Salisediminibacterium beveridgei]AOM83686.1 Na+ driven multidrug efflux pump [Salisediminibacterium beveridgei]
MQAKSYDFTEGSIMKKMILFSSPIFLTNVLQTSYQLVDSLWVGNLLGASALGAISISGVVVFTILSFIIGLNTSALTILSQYKGAKDDKGLAKALNAFVVTLGLLTLLVGIIGFFLSETILGWMGTPEEILPMAALYLRINFAGVLFLFGYNFIATVLRSLGDSKTPVRFVAMALLLNSVLDPLFIYVFDWGIAGAGIATIVSQGSAFTYGLIFSIRRAGVPFTMPRLPETALMKKIFKLGLPSGMSMVVISAGVLAIMTVVTSFGESTVAGFGAAQRLDSLVMLPALTLGSALNAMAGQNIGAGKWDRVGEITRSGLILIAVVSVTICTLVFLNAGFLIRMFVDDPDTIAFGERYVRTVALFYPFLGINFVLNGVIRAAGGMFQVFVLNVISFWILRFPLTWLFATLYGEVGIGMGMAASLLLSSLIAIGYYKLGNWRDIKVLEEK